MKNGQKCVFFPFREFFKYTERRTVTSSRVPFEESCLLRSLVFYRSTGHGRGVCTLRNARRPMFLFPPAPVGLRLSRR